MSSVWRYIRLHDYARPPEPSTEIARKGFKALFSRLRPASKISEPLSLEAEIRTAPHGLLDALAPAPVLTVAEDALASALKPWLDSNDPEPRAQVIIGAPGSGTSQILTGWAQKHNLRVIEPPDLFQLFEGKAQFNPDLYEAGTDTVIIPSLERYFLRHYNGLTLIRQLINCIWNKQNKFVIGCNSWAWAYLSKTIMIDRVFPKQYVLEAFDGERLKQWFSSLVAAPGKNPVKFRQLDNGSSILSLEDINKQKAGEISFMPENGKNNPKAEENDFLVKLAAYSRGIPLIAWAAWRHCLYITTDDSIDEEVKRSAASDNSFTVWVKPWPQVEIPEMPPEITKCEQFILHTLLIHAGLTEEMINNLLPYQSSDVVKGLSRLYSAGLIKTEENMWRVSLFGYPTVRRNLENMNFLVDPI